MQKQEQDQTVFRLNFIQLIKHNISRLGAEASWIFLGQSGTAIAGLLGIKLLTQVLDPSEFGKLALANTIIILIGTSFFGPFGQGLMRFWPISKNRGDLDSFYSFSNRLHNKIISITLPAIAVPVVVLIITKRFDIAVFSTLILGIGVATGLFSLRTSVFTAARQRRRVSLLNISNTFLRPFIATFLALLIVAKAEIALTGYLIASLFVLLITERFYSHIVSRISPNERAPLLKGLGKEILSYSWPFIIWSAFGWIHMSCDKWAIQTFNGPEVVGAFTVVSQLAVYPLIFGSGFLSSLFTPIAFQKGGDLSNNQNIIYANKILTFMTSMFVIGALLLIVIFSIFHESLVLFISNIHFARFSFLLPWLTAAWTFFYLGQILSSFGMLANKPQLYIYPKLASAIVAGVSTFYLSATNGPSGVVCGLAAAGLIYAVWCTVIYRKLIKEPLISNLTYKEEIG